MKRHNLTLIETTNLNDVKEGDIYVKFDSSTGLIKELSRRRNGKMASMLHTEHSCGAQQEVVETPASEDILDVKPLKIE